MIMKGNIMPRLSTSGIALAAALAVVGWFAAPVWAGPPEGKGTKAGEATTEGSGSTFEQFNCKYQGAATSLSDV